MSAQLNQCSRDSRYSPRRPPTLIAERPPWSTALKRLVSPQQWRCCLIPEQPTQPDYREDFIGNGKTIKLNNSSTTCDLSDDDSEASIEVGGHGWLTESNSSTRGKTPSENSTRRGHVRSRTSTSGLNLGRRRSSQSRSKQGNRARLGSSSSLSLKTADSPRTSQPRLDSSCSSINSVDSLHRRSNANALPKLDDIWNKPIQSPVQQAAAPIPLVNVRPSLYHSRGISVSTQISAITLDDHEDEKEDDEVCFDLSISEKDEKDDDPTVHEALEQSSPPSGNQPAEKTHKRNVSFCSVVTETSSSPTSVIQQAACEGADSDGNVEVVPYLPDISASRSSKGKGDIKKEVQSASRPPPSPKSVTWARKKSLKSLTDKPSSQEASPRQNCATGQRQSSGRESSMAFEYLPIHPVPRLSLFSSKATVLSAGWAAVFWESPIAKLPTRYSVEVPKVKPENLFYIQLLTGGMLQLTPLVDAEQKMILMTPKAVSKPGDNGDNWRVPLVSRRAGHCLVMDAAASTIRAQEHKIYILPVNIPPERLTQFSQDTDGNIGDTSSEEDIFFAPFGAGSGSEGTAGTENPQPYAPYHQHDAVMHLRFAMEAALSMDAALRFGRAARR